MSQTGQCIALTGATGFLGSHIADVLLAEGFQVRAAVRPTSNLRWLTGKPLQTLPVDLLDPAACANFLDGTDGLIHCAGLVSGTDEHAYNTANVATTRTLLAAAATSWQNADQPDQKTFLLVSSLAAHGPAGPEQPALETDPCRPVTAYGRSKAAAEALLSDGVWPFRTVIIRPPGLYGPRDADFLPLFKAAQTGFSARIGTHLQALSLVDGRDAAQAAVSLLTTPQAEGVFFVDDGKIGYDFHEMAAALSQAAGRKVRLLTIPLSLMKLTATLVGKKRAARSPVLNVDRLHDLVASGWVCNGHKLTATTGFQAAYDLTRGFTETMAFYQEHHWL